MEVWVEGLGCGVWGVESGIQSSGFRVQDSENRAPGFGIRDSGFSIRVSGSRFQVKDLGCGVDLLVAWLECRRESTLDRAGLGCTDYDALFQMKSTR